MCRRGCGGQPEAVTFLKNCETLDPSFSPWLDYGGWPEIQLEVRMFTLAPPRGFGPTTHKEVEIFQQQVRGERKAEIQALRDRAQTLERSASAGGLLARPEPLAFETTLADFEFPESPSVLASPAFRTLRSAGRMVSVPSPSGTATFQMRPVTADFPRQRVSPPMSYTTRLSMGLGCCTPMERYGVGKLSM
ncbi:hypothetical protein AK812_SmicGene34399 [Symbiodinium microadriaticum]|uniref:Uncharacterized protein n=1 Tax=Symbiodinium microadriaticum TaxID=2951 RepID=A0A1Q9CP49_SYMMI|nr:hypothetical protein AK812_SmicGene34399 [Symbiodinium microadriaticum]